MQLNARLILIGMMGSGKSYWAKQLGAHFHAPFYDTDEQIEQQQGMSITKIFDELGEPVFRAYEKELIHQYEWPVPAVIACGGGLPCFAGNMEQLKKLGKVVWFNPPVEAIVERLWDQTEKRPMVAACNTKAELFAKIEQLLLVRAPFYQLADVVVTNPYPSLHELLEILKLSMDQLIVD